MEMATEKFTFCPPNVTFTEIWVNNGMSRCFANTVSIVVLSLYLLIFGTLQLWLYRRRSEIDRVLQPRNLLYILQICCLYIIPVLNLVWVILQATVLGDKKLYGYMILNAILTVIVYLYSVYIMLMERRLRFSMQSQGHGVMLIGFWTLSFVVQNLTFVNMQNDEWWFKLSTASDKIEMALFILQYVIICAIFILGLIAPGMSTVYENNYREFDNGRGTQSTQPRFYTERLEDNNSTWKNVWHKTKTIAPFLWPTTDILLQLRVVLCFALLAGGRLINLYVPIYNKRIVDSVSELPIQFRWELVLIYVGLKFLQGGGTGGMGLLNNLRSFLWIRIQQYTTREVEVELFRHLHSLSLRWHLGRKTGEVLRVMDRGTDSINNLLNYVLFQIIPTIIDILIAVVFFISAFNKWFGLIVFSTMILYIITTITITEWRTKFQRRMNLADNALKAKSVDSLLNFETVKYYGAEEYEVETYKKSILNYQKEEWNSMFTLNILNTIQNVIISSGLLAGSLLCLHLVVSKQGLTIGDYVLFASYIIQLYVPLNWFGTYYRAIQKNFVDMENMFDLLREKQEIADAPNAKNLCVEHGRVEFLNVTFGYSPEKLILKNVSFVVPAGKTVALVGPSGAGKSTILRLLFRLYDIDLGTILIDGQDIKTVKQKDLREAIGVVPQDTVLFNNTVKYNIHYGSLDAPEGAVITAAKYAGIHDRILSFPDSYDTEVGERGLRLSGGEKQRVAIARTMLKNSQIILLDEATSALDTQTERSIQAALARACADHTTIIVAHRLSTIIHADEILVLKEGEIIERGKHEELIASCGTYSDMWEAQLRNEQETSERKSS